MKSERWRQVDELFERALERAPEERAAFLDAACAADPSLRREVEEMLSVDGRAGDFIKTPAFNVAAALVRGEAPTERRDPAGGAKRSAGPFDSSPIGESRFVPGDVLAGRYRVAGLLGRGGMGEVFRADDLKLKQPVALKFLPEALSNDGAALARFYQEVSVARQVSHRHVCRVYDVAEAEGAHFISMEYVSGETLSSLLKRIGRLPGDKAVETARQLCAGLAAVHDAGVLHRDLKPANVMLDERGDVRITDFGIAASAGDVRGAEALVGTPAYMSPEQLAGGELTTRSDIYSLGLVLYELFTGKRAFEAASLRELLRLRQSETQPSSPSSHVKDLDPAVERAIFLLSGDVLVARNVPLDKPPEVLAERARAVLRAAGHAAPAADTAYGFEADEDYYRYVTERDHSMTRLERFKTGQPALLQFWYRQSPRPLTWRWGSVGLEVTPDDPPPQLYSGMAGVRLDTDGRLVELQWTPPELEEAGGAPGQAPDWSALFVEAGLDLSKFRPAEPRWVPPAFADLRAAWEGVFPLQPETPLRVEAAAYRGRPVAFKLVAPWTKPPRMEPYATDPALQRTLVFLFAVFVTMIAAGVWLARRNFRMGRGDRRGGWKLALFVFSTKLVAGLVGANHVPEFQGEVRLLYLALMRALCYAAVIWLFYIALEPYVRRRSPHRLIAWTRLLAGDWRDPLVGRDVLVGTLLGIFMRLEGWFVEVAARRAGAPPDLRAPTPALERTRALWLTGRDRP